MYNVSIEQILKIKQSTLAKVFKVIMIIVCIVAALTIPQTYGVGIILLAIAIVFTVIMFKYYDAEYEYTLVESELTIDKIMSQSMRKRCGTYNISKAEVIAPANSQEALRMEHKKLKTLNYTSNDNKQDVYVAYVMDNNNEIVKLLIEPNDKMKEAFKTMIPRNFY